MDALTEIISRTTQSPTIVNNESNFVVVTYWWGSGNLNNNTARPCMSFYEGFFKKVLKFCVNSISTVNKMNPGNVAPFQENLENIVDIREFIDMLKRKINEYLVSIYSYAGIPENSSNKLEQALQFFEKQKETGKTPQNYEFKNVEYLFVIFYFISREFIKLNKQNILDLYQVNHDIERLKEMFLNNDKTIDYKTNLNELDRRKNELNDLIKRSVNIKDNAYVLFESKNRQLTKYLNQIYKEPSIQGKSLNELLIQELRYLNPLKFEVMIENWKNQCAKNNCNYLAVEYPEFAKPGGYQMAINAKPLFIKKCLELCGDKSVLYIDGDMNIRQYPVLFDLRDVDYMARGWWIDPRSSYKFEESITYDPYTFETSGGTMFFSTSEDSRLLLDMWITESSKSYQKGKADDRIISMIFNTKKMLLNMKIIQLPIEYLWLTLDYNDRLLESEIYDYNVPLMESTIIIDHPECLTSEDTASGSGASSDRTPKFYDFLDYNLEPVSEEYYEFLAFPDVKYTAGVKDYLKFMSNVYYIDDGNALLYEKGYVEQGRNTSDNEQPLYIYPFQTRFDKKNELSDIIIKRATSMNADGLYVFNEGLNLAEIHNTNFTKEEGPQIKDEVKVISLMYKLLNEGKNVLYRPSSADEGVYQLLISKLTNKYKNIEFAFVPIFNGKSYNDIFRPLIDTTNCIYISHNSTFMKNFITIFESMDELAAYFNNGFYQLLSSVRVAYLLKPKISKPNSFIGGTNPEQPESIDYEREYLEAMDYIDNFKKGGYSKKHKKTIRKNRKNKNNKKSRKGRK